jgi:hypothetical protein
MLYRSFIGLIGPAVPARYGSSADAVAVGSTSGGIDDGRGGAGEAVARTPGWEKLTSDLRIARRFTDEIAMPT